MVEEFLVEVAGEESWGYRIILGSRMKDSLQYFGQIFKHFYAFAGRWVFPEGLFWVLITEIAPPQLFLNVVVIVVTEVSIV
jgi:hypothetical protein